MIDYHLSGRARNRFDFHSTIPRARVRKDYLLACVRHAARRIRKPIGAINFILVDDRRMAKLHREFSHISGTTDVLTFDLSAGEVEGDVFICLDQARRQAKEYNIPLYEEIARLAVHGVLHLAGYEDKTDAQRKQMRGLENRSLRAGRRSA